MKKIKKLFLSMVVVSALACSMIGLNVSQNSSFNGGDTPAPTKPIVSSGVSID
ncbi:Phr family secreted Rap phosphatase inhibitor [Bacillus toyonensis]|uniref:Phr family secreted Rap phosphatase inhibitor n=1 Tax=Bacillus toyonensis TaxID=155322 RepID=UPI000BEF5C4E|nr:Phr family secreted Rap phosphatase inhibitor [Bacillus toyonensis]MCU5305217.1 Phr family secreted Rap phosphatase inhibitor [Bacillus toyonensis]MDD9265105.1 Phr family secreted Rap phosphatase inhibitor [Bacillus toyonensis]PEJ00601.1 Phr family secreted Rap phosphatase inhibitor [Bacillus toyonensis]PFZ72428.1 Phr family secreted Rap phosphatase inhibitor [Bacillus toyonensis]HDR7850782.1 Phr family secreted Rap phosphatase inhibitor [Bacillus toyonensis]